MKNIMIKETVYNELKASKGEESFSDVIGSLFQSDVDRRRKAIRTFFACMSDKEIKEMDKIVSEVLRVAKGRLF